MKIKKFVFALCLLGFIFPVYAETERDLQPANSNKGTAWGDILIACMQYQLNVKAMMDANSDVLKSLKKADKNGTNEEKQIVKQIMLNILDSYQPMNRTANLCLSWMDTIKK